MLEDNRKTIVKMMKLTDKPSNKKGGDAIQAHKQIPEELVKLVDALELGLSNCTRQRGVRWETLAVLVAPFIVKDMDSEEVGEKKSVGIKRGAPLSVKKGNQKLPGVFVEKSGDMYSVHLEKDDEAILVDPAKVIIKG